MSRGRKVGSAYPMTVLNRVFMVSSALMFVSTLWMFWDDYDRPWKKYQIKFIAMQRERARAERDNLKEDQRKAADIQAKREKAEADREANQAKIDELSASLQELKAKWFPVDMRRKFKKAGVDTYRYQHDHASYEVHKAEKKLRDAEQAGASESKLASLQKALEVAQEHLLHAEQALAQQIEMLTTLTLDTQKLEADIAVVQGKLSRYTEAQSALDKEQTKLDAARAQLTKRIAELDQGFSFQARNAPFLDMLSPNIKVEQVVLPDYKININFAKIQTVDRCMTCHVAVDKTGWDTETVEVGASEYPKIVEVYGKKNVVVDEKRSAWEKSAPFTASELIDAVAAFGPVQITSAGAAKEKRAVAAKDLPRLREIFGTHLTESREGGKLTVELPAEVKAKVRSDYTLTHPRQHPYRGHSRLDTYVGSVSAHPMNTFGCTSCHMGAGEATDFQRAVHSPENATEMARWQHDHHWKHTDDKYWNKPMFPSQYVEAGCVHCHMSMVELEPMPWMRVGAAPPTAVAWAAKADEPAETFGGQYVLEAQNQFLDHGCNGCHKVESIVGEPKIGPGLANLAVKLDREWVRRWIETPRGFRKPTRMPQVFKVPHQLEPLAHVASTAQDFGSFLALDDGEKKVGSQKIEALWKRYDTRQKLYGSIMDAEMDAIVAYLFKHSRKIDLAAPVGGAVDKGKALFLDKGCLACHVMDDYKVEGQPAKRFGPDLSNVASKLKADSASAWLYTWLMDPDTYHAGSRMPKMRLSTEEASHLAAYLGTKKGADDAKFFERAIDAGDPDLVRMRLVNFLEGNMPTRTAWNIVEALSPADRLVWLGEKVIAKQGCFGCHAMAPGGAFAQELKANEKAWRVIQAAGVEKFASAVQFEGMAGIGVELSDWGSKLMSKLEFGLQKHLEQTRWTFSKTKIHTPRIYDEGMYKAYDDLLRMPWFGFSEADASHLATYVTGLAKRELDAKYDYLRSPSNWKTRIFEVQMSTARSAPLAGKALADWTRDDHARFDGQVQRLKGYAMGAKDEGKLAKIVERLAAGAPDSTDVLGVSILAHKHEGQLDPQWSSAQDRRRAIVEGRRLVRRYNCRGCHQIEGRGGELSEFILAHRFQGADRLAAQEESPPFLNHQGERTQASWLFAFLRDPESHSGEKGMMRRWLTMKMPNFGLSVEEANVLTRYFAALAGTSWPNNERWGAPTPEEVNAATKMFETKKCLTCHGTAVTGTRAAPFLEPAGGRLNEEWIRQWLLDPKQYLPYTSMIEDAMKGDDGKWLADAHAEARKHVRAIMDPKAVAEIRKRLGN